MNNILVSLELDTEHKKALEEAAGIPLTFMTPRETSSADVSGYDAILGIVSFEKLKEAVNLKWLQIPWAGVEGLSGIVPTDARISNGSGAYGVSVAEHMLALTLSLAYNIPDYVRLGDQKSWTPINKLRTIAGSTVLVLGTGDIGSNYASMVKALGAVTIGICRSNTSQKLMFDEIYTADKLNDVIGRADIIAVATPGGRNSFHILGEEQFALMRENCIVVSGGRGTNIDTAALCRALNEERIAGAGLDVIEGEPLDNKTDIWSTKNLLITPHVAGKFGTKYVFDKVFDILLENISRYTKGLPLINETDKDLEY